ncbi:hypothetical protein EVG20_g10906 [Dentipellis fragilis]|uniref:SLC41A/MgtE integral membrane domain-containing protein n=1 Tax=Dentipellis fragilis TaxID=205917 RepID=A0A4Y9XPH2_9AGAM|nr:hypothetical protein EVG20_g10906 [Dentipellis fragilis]
MPSDDAASSADEDFEMARLDDIAVTPNPRLSNGYHHYPRFDEDDDDDGARALLGAGGRSSRWRQTLFGKKATVRYHIQNIVIETLPTLLFTTTGLMFTGELLATVSHREAMTRINELIMIVPVILNLKGNLEMNLSARLGTAANMGALDTPKSRNAIVFGNLALLQVQAAVVSFIAAIVAFILGLVVPDGVPDEPASTGNTTTEALAFHVTRTALHYARVPRPTPPISRTAQSGFAEFVMVAATSMSAACISALFLGSFMCGLIVLCRKLGRDPDNIAPPIAACLGDLVTLFLLSLISGFLIRFLNTPGPYIVILLVVVSAVACGVLTRRNEHVWPLLTQGWAPLFGAMVISSGTGIVLDTFVSRYTNYALLAIAISGTYLLCTSCRAMLTSDRPPWEHGRDPDVAAVDVAAHRRGRVALDPHGRPSKARARRAESAAGPADAARGDAAHRDRVPGDPARAQVADAAGTVPRVRVPVLLLRGAWIAVPSAGVGADCDCGWAAGDDRAVSGTGADERVVGARARPGHVCAADPLCVDGPGGAAATCGVFRDCGCARGARPHVVLKFKTAFLLLLSISHIDWTYDSFANLFSSLRLVLLWISATHHALTHSSFTLVITRLICRTTWK